MGIRGSWSSTIFGTRSGPDGLHHAERPRALQEAVGRAHGAGRGEGKDVLPASVLEGIAGQHRADGQQPKEREPVHWGYLSGQNTVADVGTPLAASGLASRLIGSTSSVFRKGGRIRQAKEKGRRHAPATAPSPLSRTGERSRYAETLFQHMSRYTRIYVALQRTAPTALQKDFGSCRANSGDESRPWSHRAAAIEPWQLTSC